MLSRIWNTKINKYVSTVSTVHSIGSNSALKDTIPVREAQIVTLIMTGETVSRKTMYIRINAPVRSSEALVKQSFSNLFIKASSGNSQ